MGDAGNYEVIVTNAYGSATSQVAALGVAAQPANQTVYAGTNVTFSVTVDGAGPFTYQWLKNGTNMGKTITTVAGGGAIGVSGFSGDGGPATNAELSGPNAATVDAFGNIFIADWNNNRIREVTTNGIISTVAGDGSEGASIDGNAATNTSVYFPAVAILDSAGDLFISEYGSGRIAKVGTNGILTNLAGTGNRLAPFGEGDGGPATNAEIWPAGIALDAFGNLFIADKGNNRIRKVGTNGIITPVAGGGALGYAEGYSGDGGPATNALLYAPSGVFLDSLGNLFISDTGNNRIREVGTNGIITTIAGNGIAGFSGDGGAATNASLDFPAAVAMDPSGNLLIADAGNSRIRQVDIFGTITTVAGGGTSFPGDGGPATRARLFNTTYVAVDTNGNVFVDDNFDSRIRELCGPGPNLLIQTVTTNDAGAYSVVVTSPYGSVTSAVASLTVSIPSTPPQIITNDASFGFVSNQFGFNLKGAFGQTIVVDGSTNLVTWSPLSTNSAGNSLIYFSDPASTNIPWRFYRARLQ